MSYAKDIPATAGVRGEPAVSSQMLSTMSLRVPADFPARGDTGKILKVENGYSQL
jgi:hypothetical protein